MRKDVEHFGQTGNGDPQVIASGPGHRFAAAEVRE